MPAMDSRTAPHAVTCNRCGQRVHWYSRRSGDPITIGGRQYGDCRCDLTTWVRDAGRAWQVGHWKGAGQEPLQEVRS